MPGQREVRSANDFQDHMYLDVRPETVKNSVSIFSRSKVVLPPSTACFTNFSRNLSQCFTFCSDDFSTIFHSLSRFLSLFFSRIFSHVQLCPFSYHVFQRCAAKRLFIVCSLRTAYNCPRDRSYPYLSIMPAILDPTLTQNQNSKGNFLEK